MNVSLTPELEKHVQSQLETGHYRSASEVIREALRDQVRSSVGSSKSRQSGNVKDCYSSNAGGYWLL